MRAHFIPYVSDQRASAEFYAAVLGRPTDLDVLGMTEFHLRDWGQEAAYSLDPDGHVLAFARVPEGS